MCTCTRIPRKSRAAAARLFVDYAWQSIAKYGQFMVALSGGNTPRMFFEFLASAEFRGQVDWAESTGLLERRARRPSGQTRKAITGWPGANF